MNVTPFAPTQAALEILDEVLSACPVHPGFPRAVLDEIARMADAGAPRIVEANGSRTFSRALLVPSVSSGRPGVGYEGAVHGVMRLAGPRRAGCLVPVSLGPIFLGADRAHRLDEAVEAFAARAGDPTRPRASGSLRLEAPRVLRREGDWAVDGQRFADQMMAAARRAVDVAVAGMARQGVYVAPWDGTLSGGTEACDLVLTIADGSHHRVAALPEPNGFLGRTVRAGEAVDLPPGARPILRGQGEALAMPLIHALCAALSARVDRARDAFAAGLDRRAAGPLLGLGIPLAGYNWLLKARTSRLRSDRAQAIAAYPILAEVGPDEGVDAAVSARAPLIPALAARFRTSEACARALGRKP